MGGTQSPGPCRVVPQCGQMGGPRRPLAAHSRHGAPCFSCRQLPVRRGRFTWPSRKTHSMRAAMHPASSSGRRALSHHSRPPLRPISYNRRLRSLFRPIYQHPLRRWRDPFGRRRYHSRTGRIPRRSGDVQHQRTRHHSRNTSAILRPTFTGQFCCTSDG